MKSISFKDKFEKQVAESINSNEEVRDAVENVVSDRFGEKESFDERFDRILNEMRIDRERKEREWSEITREWAENNRKWEESLKKSAEYDRKWEENQKIIVANDRRWEENQKKLVENDQKWAESVKEWAENNRRWEESLKKSAEYDRKWEENQKIIVANDRRWEENQKKLVENDQKWAESVKEWAENNRRWEESLKKSAEYDRKWEENQKNINQILASIKIVEINDEKLRKLFTETVGSLGTRWGTRSEQSFRNALKGILEEATNYKVLNVIENDPDGVVFGWPAQVELDIVVTNGKFFIIEIKASVSASEVAIFVKKAKFYEEKHNKKANALVIISPMIDGKARDFINDLGIIAYSYASDVEPGALDDIGAA